MDYESALKLFFLLGFLCCWVLALTAHGVVTAARLYLLRRELEELVKRLEGSGEAPGKRA